MQDDKNGAVHLAQCRRASHEPRTAFLRGSNVAPATEDFAGDLVAHRSHLASMTIKNLVFMRTWLSALHAQELLPRRLGRLQEVDHLFSLLQNRLVDGQPAAACVVSCLLRKPST